MKHIYSVFIVVMLLMVSCTNKKHPSDYYPKSAPSCDSNTEPVRQDTFKYEATEQQSSSSASFSASSKYKEKDIDNMRGFDPASEDDMDDNGMSRYMENNDEEGLD